MLPTDICKLAAVKTGLLICWFYDKCRGRAEEEEEEEDVLFFCFFRRATFSEARRSGVLVVSLTPSVLSLVREIRPRRWERGFHFSLWSRGGRMGTGGTGGTGGGVGARFSLGIRGADFKPTAQKREVRTLIFKSSERRREQSCFHRYCTAAPHYTNTVRRLMLVPLFAKKKRKN